MLTDDKSEDPGSGSIRTDFNFNPRNECKMWVKRWWLPKKG